MKKTLLSVCAFLIASIAFAQQTRQISTELHFDESKHSNVVPTQSSLSSAAAPFFTNDFSDLADWTTNDALNNGSQDWVIGTAGPVGGFSSPMGAIASTTTANGFALYDSDALGVSATNTQDATITYNGTVDCSAYLNVNINFESSHRKFQDSVFVEVSNDAWVTFERYEVHANQGVNDQSANPEFVSVNISSAAGNQDSVSFRFHYEGQWDYAWMVDDVSFTETPDNLLSSGAETFGGWWIGYQSTGDIGSDFTFYPLTQASAQPYRFEGVLNNQGVNALDNSVLHVNVIDESGSSQDFTSNPISVSSGTTDTVAVSDFTPTQTGAYNFSYWATSDSFPTTDTTVMSAIVTDTVYGVDYDWNSDGANAQGGYFLGKPCGGNVLGNVFDIYAVDTVTSISFHVNESSAFGNDVKVELYDIDDPTVIDPIFLEESDGYTLLPTDTNKWITLKLLNPYPVTAGIAYLAAVKGSISLQDTTLISSSSNENSSSWLQDNCVATTATSTHVPGDWYSIGADGLLIRMNFGTIAPPSGVNNIKQSQFNLYPNPTNGIFVIELEENSKYEVTVIDILGKTVYTSSINDMNTTIDLSGFEKGVYTVELKDENSKYTEKLIVE